MDLGTWPAAPVEKKSCSLVNQTGDCASLLSTNALPVIEDTFYSKMEKLLKPNVKLKGQPA